MIALELLAPARNADIGIAALRCGADAVYIGGPSFGARVAAGNSIEDIARLCLEARRYGARTFVTVNTLARDDSERKEAVRMMCSLRGKGVSAFIIQDCTLLPLLYQEGEWEEEFHASTQCAIRTPERARELAAMGFSRLILERELSLGQIHAIHEAVPDVDIEFFVHGALCVCYSGDCYLSQMLTGRSANRGECAQPCRNLYNLTDGSGKVIVKNSPLLSLKDYCLIDRMEDLAKAGVVSFKIEGRLKNESYVKNIVRAYSQKLDEIVQKNPEIYRRASYGRVQGGFTPDINKTFNRAYTQLFIDGKRGEWHSGDSAKGMGEHIGKVARVSGSSIVLEPLKGISLHNGDGLCCIIGGEVVGFRADRVEAKGNAIICKTPSKLKAGAAIWRNLDTAFEKELSSQMPSRMLRVSLSLSFNGGVLNVEAIREDGVKAALSYDISSCETAGNQARMNELLCTQLGKTSGIYSFRLEACSTNPLPLLSASFLNSIRRDAAQKLEDIPVSISLKGAHAADLSDAPLSHPQRSGELMRTKYCIRHRLGLCPKQNGRNNIPELYLENNGKRLHLLFDCAHCEMIAKEA